MFNVICNSAGREKRYGIRGDHTTVHDLSSIESEANAFANLLNRGEASEIHVYDLIEDWFGR